MHTLEGLSPVTSYQPSLKIQAGSGRGCNEMGGRYEFPAGEKPFSPRGMEQSLQLLSSYGTSRPNPGVCFSCLPS